MSENDLRLSGFADEIDSDLDSQMEVLQECNISYMEFRSVYGKNISEYTLEEAREIKKILDMEGIKISAIGSPLGKVSITDDFEVHYRLFRHVVELAKLFDTKYIRIFSFYIPKGEAAESYRDRVLENLGKMISYAKEQDITLLHENEKGIYGDTIDHCKDLMEALYCANFKMTFDFANFVQCGQDALEAYRLLKSYIAYVHIKDALRENHMVVPAGLGDGHIAEVIAMLKEEQYDGFYSLEPHLTEFIGLKQLEREGDMTLVGTNMSDGRIAFLTAYKAFIRIMNQFSINK